MANLTDIVILIMLLIFTGVIIFAGYEAWKYLDPGPGWTNCLKPVSVQPTLTVYQNGSFQVNWNPGDITRSGSNVVSVTISDVTDPNNSYVLSSGFGDASGTITGCFGNTPPSGHSYQAVIIVLGEDSCPSWPPESSPIVTQLTSGSSSDCSGWSVGWPALYPQLKTTSNTFTITFTVPTWVDPGPYTYY